MLCKPQLAKCCNRQETPKSHPASGAPEDWYKNEWLKELDLTGVSFDFFVNWSHRPLCLTPVIWIKRILAAGDSYEQFLRNTSDVLISEFGIHYLQTLLLFASAHGLTVQLIVFRDDQDWTCKTATLLIIDASLDAQLSIRFSAQQVAISEFMEIIQRQSGGPVTIGAKGLIYGTSRLECFLSRTASAYPGDADLVLVDSQQCPVAIVEFKKHTLDSPITNQKLSNYYPSPDGRKYDRLAVLRDHLSGSRPPLPILVIYYPTNGALTEGIMELVSGAVGQLATVAFSGFPLPHNGSKECAMTILQKSIRAVNYHRARQ